MDYLDYKNELYHYGIKGQKWGIRRYQNFDGSYTRAGLERYRKSLDTYERRKREYKSIKKDPVASKLDKQYAKANYKAARKRVNKDYRHLRLDKKADKGKLLYAKGVRITDNSRIAWTATKVGSMMIAGAQVAANQGYIDRKMANTISFAGAGLAAVGHLKSAIDVIPNNYLRAYYSHTSRY